jgi:serine-type D-Ala-D-Ala carboxypeptidase (penicillin-binding protein 5/6)
MNTLFSGLRRTLIGALICASTSVFAQVPPPELGARAWLLIDVTSNARIGASNPEMRVEPASLTKLMTAYLVFSALRDGKVRLDQAVTPTSLILKVKGEESRMFIEPGKPVLIKELLQGMIVQSGNDASLALAEAVGGTEEGFVTLMNREAERLGMKDSHFANPTGMPDPTHYTTAQDLSILATRLLQDFPQYTATYSQKEFTYNSIKQPNRNRLLWLDSSVDGLKTGHTAAAGYCLISTAHRPLALSLTGGKPKDRRLVAVLLGAKDDASRAQESLKLLNYGFQQFDTVHLYAKGHVLATPEVFKGSANQVKIGVNKELYITVPTGVAGRLQPVLERAPSVLAPIEVGQVMGTVKLMDGKTVLTQFPVVALEAVPEAGFFGRMIDSFRLWTRSSSK